jgi:hypothetical protein
MTIPLLLSSGIEARRADIAASADLTALLDRLVARAAPVLATMPPVPAVKAMLSRDGGVCPDDGGPLQFDPWSPDRHRCPRCGREFSGERHHAHWARAQHLWLAERAAHLATIHAFTGDAAAADRAREILAAYHTLYRELPNRDNVLGPSHLFFSTYLESIWILHYLAAAMLLRETGALSEADIEGVNAVADEAAMIIGSFNEGMSNRQTWNAAALTAIGTWFDDEELIRNSIEDRSGLLGHLTDGFGEDGMWFEGENYHLFALRGLLIGLQWAATAGAELLAEPALARQLAAALMAPTLTALPDLTFPARKDSRYGVSLGHPAYLECWEAGWAWLGDERPAELTHWLHEVHDTPARKELLYDSWLNEEGEALGATRGRADLSWWALLSMAPALPPATGTRAAPSRLLEAQGIAILRRDDRYLSLEFLGGGDGHGHPDRLHLTLHADGVHWLPDPGTGSYVAPDLFWYRSTLAHNAPRLDGSDQPLSEGAQCVAWDTKGEWQWAVGRWDHVRRTTILGPKWLLDITESADERPHLLELPWHLAGTLTMETAGEWSPTELTSDFVTAVERFAPGPPATTIARAASGDKQLRVLFAGEGEIVRATAPGLPGSTEPAQFLVRRASGKTARLVTVVDLSGNVREVTTHGDTITVTDDGGSVSVQLLAAEAHIKDGQRTTILAGVRPEARAIQLLFADKPLVSRGRALWVATPPTLDGTLAGFDLSSPLRLEGEHHYLRSEEPYPGPAEFAAKIAVNWDEHSLYVAVDVTKRDLVVRPADAPPLLLDNEPDDIHSDGVQLYYRRDDDAAVGYLVRPGDDGALLVRPIGGAAEGAPLPTGRWQRTKRGYRMTMALPCEDLARYREHGRFTFDVVINEMHADRLRRAGQLAWSGGHGWVYLRGDRHDPAQFGVLEFIG